MGRRQTDEADHPGHGHGGGTHTGGGGEEEVRVRLGAHGVLGCDDGVEEVRDVDLLKRGVHVVATAGGGDGGLMAEATDVVDDGDNLFAGGDVLGEVFLEELMTVG